jgi:glutaminyl-peptide cyclotransferase
MRLKSLVPLPLLLAVAPVTAEVSAPAAPAAIQVEVAQIVKRYPHDPKAWTEGLFIDRGELFESTGEPNRSSVRRVDLTSGRVLKSVAIPMPNYGEGIAPWQGQVLSLTWRNQTGFRWDRKTLKQLGSFKYDGEGWSLTTNGRELVMSDGTDVLRFVDPKTFTVKHTLKVTVQDKPLRMINELEWVNGLIYANIWLTDFAVKIDPVSGKVVGVIDLSEIHRAAGAFGNDQVANGIAWDAKARKLYMTGKEWPALFEVKLVPAGKTG